MNKSNGKNVPRVAVITGGHPFDVPNFHKFFRAIKDADIYIQHMDEFASSDEKTRNSYDAVLFYIMLIDVPSDDNVPGYAGKPKSALENLTKTGQAIFILHHAILAYPKWDLWNDLVGINKREFGYHPDQNVHINISKKNHPIVKGLKDWDMPDETYTMDNADEGSEILLTADHPKSMKTIAWTRKCGKSRVFCLQSGHDNLTWENPNFAEVVRRGIQWCAGRL